MPLTGEDSVQESDSPALFSFPTGFGLDFVLRTDFFRYRFLTLLFHLAGFHCIWNFEYFF